ncbi:4-oxalomesaconate tautomerase [Actinospica durhamensis]|uniref:4-oxalomesaconate tautomerase n=1 Tax=Actinospica durhamensis TaxID=1508375 RepID=A0A941EL65_9ACTN|nr:4-oxalomesaconate tautomerase [Actinospica durhamensis]MBR7832567.1 4-oxalomesaconate tautomerase [Actinospica durhamensis]
MSEGAGIPCILMRGGTSKGPYFLARDLPADREARDELVLRVMGSPDPRQIDGIGGAHPLTSKVAVVSCSAREDADVDYLFLQVGVGEAFVTDKQNCGNLLAGVGPFAVERGLVAAAEERTSVRIHLVNTGESATATFATPGGCVDYAEPVLLAFASPEGKPLLPTGRVRDEIDGLPVTCIDNGMPTVVVRAGDLGVTGYETPAELEADERLTERISRIRTAALELMGLGDAPSLPKISLLAPPRDGGTVSTRTFIPVRCHEAIGVLGAVSVATALLLPGAVGAELAAPRTAPGAPLRLEHPTGAVDVSVELDPDAPADRPRTRRAGLVRTARKLFEGTVFPRPSHTASN